MFMQRSWVFVVAVLFFLSALDDGCKMGFFGKITGKVVEPERLQPLAGVRLMIEDPKYNGETDANGNFTINGVESGVHTLTCKGGRPLYEDQVMTVTVRQDSPVVLFIVAEFKSEAVRPLMKDTVKLSALKSGYELFRGGYGLGLEPTVINYLVAVHDNKRRLLARPEALRGYLEVRDSAQALEFARLFTGLNTYYLFRDANPDNIYIEVTAAVGKSSYGEMPREMFTKLGLKPPFVVSDASHFYITRYLLSTAH